MLMNVSASSCCGFCCCKKMQQRTEGHLWVQWANAVVHPECAQHFVWNLQMLSISTFQWDSLNCTFKSGNVGQVCKICALLLLSVFLWALVNVVEEENGTILPMLYECLICIRVFISTFWNLFMWFAQNQSHLHRDGLIVIQFCIPLYRKGHVNLMNNIYQLTINDSWQSFTALFECKLTNPKCPLSPGSFTIL